jgi:D-beta-D-heptose 7-phosphate kinase/D-beta-D-heptose 1-phosphate adenosyltransferase
MGELNETGLVDAVSIFDTEEELRRMIEARKPDIIFKGADYAVSQVVGADIARIVLIPRLAGYSTTEEIRKRA